jgi:prepilin-type N-terminal cleavage/methylation domain-containing protein
MSDESGFTLVEIMIVVLIITMILMIAIPSYENARTTSEAKTCVTSLRQIAGAKEIWAMHAGGGDADTPTWDNLTIYLSSTPSCPTGGTYTIGDMATDPTCSIGGDHIITAGGG